VAERIVADAAAELLALIEAGARWVGDGPAGSGSVAVALGGRLLADGTVLRRRLDDLLNHSLLPVVARTAAGSALDGALLLGQTEAAHRYGPLVRVWQSDSTQ
jgi:hypothetical protein